MADTIKQVEVLSAKDETLHPIFTPEFLERFEVHSYRNASRILATACPDEMAELIACLMAYQIKTDDIVAQGKNKSQIALNMDNLLFPLGWYETLITGELKVTKTTTGGVGKNSNQKIDRVQKNYVIKNFIDGHKIDFVKNRVAFDMEWNSKDQTFDRDLYALRAFYDCGIIDAGVLLTRATLLGDVFADLSTRTTFNLAAKYGASTTWMGKLLPRLDAGRGGGCPVLAIGIKQAVIEDLEPWKAAHPVLKQKGVGTVLTEDDDED